LVDDDHLRFPAALHHHSRWTWLFLLLTGLLSSTILLKVAEIQYLELVYAFQLFLLFCLFVRNELKFRLFRPGVVLAVLYLIFMVAAFLLSLVALRNQFFYPPGLNLLNYPVWITLARSIELIIDAGIMIYLAQEFRRDRTTLVFTMRIYFWAGVVSALYSVLSYPLNVLHIRDLGTYDLDHRMRGFYNEGGPYGLYILSLLLVGLALYRLGWSRRNHLRAAFLLLLVVLVNSKSKAAISAAIAMMIVNTLMISGVKKRVAVLAVFLIAAAALSISVNLPEQLRNYQRSSAIYERMSNSQSNNGNVIGGRVAGAFIVPRMVAAHPVLGVGWGNYGLVRNNPLYRGASAWANGDDVPSLGLFGETAELGIPLTLFLLACLMFPYFYLRHIKAPLYVKNLALIQPVIHIFGGQLNLTYPWIVTAFALAIGFLERRSAPAPAAVPAPALSGRSILT
jgi:O-antigen ligase